MAKEPKKAFSDSKKYVYRWLNSESQRRSKRLALQPDNRLDEVLAALHRAGSPAKPKAGPHNP